MLLVLHFSVCFQGAADKIKSLEISEKQYECTFQKTKLSFIKSDSLYRVRL